MAKEEETFAETKDAKLITQRVMEIITQNDQGNGYWSSCIMDMYTTKFKERLPANWVELVKSETDLLTFHAVGEHFAIYFSKTNDSSVDKKTNESRTPLPVMLPDGETCIIHVLVVHSVDRVNQLSSYSFY